MLYLRKRLVKFEVPSHSLKRFLCEEILLLLVCFFFGKRWRTPVAGRFSEVSPCVLHSPLGQSNSNSDTCAEFRIKYVGAIEKLKLSEGKSLEGPLDLINYIDVAQVKKKKNVCFIRLMAWEKDVVLPVALKCC